MNLFFNITFEKADDIEHILPVLRKHGIKFSFGEKIPDQKILHLHNRDKSDIIEPIAIILACLFVKPYSYYSTLTLKTSTAGPTDNAWKLRDIKHPVINDILKTFDEREMSIDDLCTALERMTP